MILGEQENVLFLNLDLSADVVYHLQKSYPYLLIFTPIKDFLDVYNVEQAGKT